MKNLGRIIPLLLILQQTLFAGVVASVDVKDVEYGEVITLNLAIDGNDVKRPEIYTLCGEDVIETGSSTSINMINGTYKKSYILSYKFIPKRSCTIKSLEVEVDETIEKTEPIEIKVSKRVASKSDAVFLSIQSNKKDVYVGEAFDLTLVFKQKKSLQIVDNKFQRPEFKGFWLKGEPKQELDEEGEFLTTKLHFKLAAQREGELYIEPAKISLASRQNRRDYFGGFFPDLKWKHYFSNDLNITAKALPDDIALVGNATIQASVDKLEVNANEAVNLNIQVKGDVNLEDIKSFKPYIGEVSVFDEKIKIDSNELSQKITFVADKDFEIPAFSLRIFDPKTQEIKNIQTKAIQIKVKQGNTPKKQELIVKKEPKKQEVQVKESQKNFKTFETIWLVIIFLIGVFVGIFIMILKPLLRWKTSSKKIDLKDDKAVLVKLLPYKDKEDVKKIVEILEANLYTQDKQNLDKKALKEIMKRYEIL